MKKLLSFILFVVFLFFVPKAFAAGGTFTASNYSYNTSTHQLNFHANNFVPDNTRWWRYGICDITVSGQNALTNDTHCAYTSNGTDLGGDDRDVSVTLNAGN